MAASEKDKPGKLDETAKGSQPKNVMEKKHYYDTMMKTREELFTKRDGMDDEIKADEKEKKKLEQMIDAMNQWLAKAIPATEKKKDQLRRYDRDLDKLEDMLKSLTPRTLARRVRFMNMPTDPDERAEILREDYEQLIANNAAPKEPIIHVSATPRGLGIEAVTDKYAVATNRDDPDVKVRMRIYSSGSAEPDPPVILFFHGGGFVCGDLDTCDWPCRTLAALSGATVASVKYRRAPEHKFPAAAVDAYEALRWIASGGLGFTPRKLAVAGDCAGGGLAAACSLTARDDPDGPAIAVQILAYPWLDLRVDAPSLSSELADGRYGLFKDELDWYREVYAPPGSDADGGGGEWTKDPRASPLIAESLSGLPRTFLAYTVRDMLAVESVAFAERLRSELGAAFVHTMRLKAPEHHHLSMGNLHESHAVLTAAAAYASAMLWA